MANRLDVKLRMDVVDAEDHSEFTDVEFNWYDLRYADLVQIQGLLLNMGGSMQAWGQQLVAAKAAEEAAAETKVDAVVTV